MAGALAVVVPAVDTSRAGERGRVEAERWAAMAWDDFLAEFEPAIHEALERYRRMRELAPPEHGPVVELLIAHE